MPSKTINKRHKKNISNQDNTEDGLEQQIASEDVENLRKLIQDVENNHVVQTKELEAQKMTQSITEKPDIELIKKDNRQYVFHITYKGESGSETYSVQIFKSKTKLELGKLKMPTGLDFVRILSETPLTNNQGITKFLRNCQRYISVYHERKKKFDDCKLFLQDAVNCYIDTNLNYTMMYIQLMKVFDTSNKRFHNVTIYLFFDLAGSETTEIKVETNVDEKYRDATLKHLEFCLEIFSNEEIKDALEIFEDNERTGPISWKLEFAGDDLQYSTDSTSQSDENKSDSDEEALPEVPKKRILRKRKPTKSKEEQKNQMLNKRTIKRKRKGPTLEIEKKSTSKTKLKQTKLNFSTQKKSSNDTNNQSGKKSSSTKDDDMQDEDTDVSQNANATETSENIKDKSRNEKNPEVRKHRKNFVTRRTPSPTKPPVRKKKKTKN